MKLKNKEVRIEPTNICNAHCIMCPREKMKRPQGVMSFKLFKKILDQCIDAGITKVSIENFGEPFLDEGIYEKAAYAKSRGLKTMTITNVSLINPEKAVSVFDTIRVSLYATTKETFSKIHKGLDYETVYKHTNKLLNLGKDIQMFFLLMEENKHEYKDWLKKYDLFAKVSVWKPHNWINGRQYRGYKRRKTSCGRPEEGSLQVQWDGKVVPCCFDFDSKIVLGDFNYQSLEEIMKGDKYNALREAHRKGEFHRYPTCDVCDQLNKREDVLVYSTIKEAKVGRQNTNYHSL